MQPSRPAHYFAPAAALLTLLLSACQKPPEAVVEAPPPLPPHLGPPPAGTCIISPFKVADGGTASVTMTISNDGGFCAVSLVDNAGQPFDVPLVHEKPVHGDETVVKYNGRTSIEYAAKAGFVGHDGFTVRLENRDAPGATTVTLSIDVQAASALPPATPPAKTS